MGAAAVLAVYAAGYARTNEAAAQLAARSGSRRAPAAGRSGETPDRIAGATALASALSSGQGTNRPTDSGAADGLAIGKLPAETRPGSGPIEAGASATTVAAPLSAASSAPVSLASPAPQVAATVQVPAVSTPAPAPVAPAAPAVASAAPAATPTVTPPGADSAKRVKWRDGTFSGWGTSRHGDVEATVIIEGGKITAAAISRCLTRYSCSWIAHLQPQVVERQSPEVDNVSGATESANAFYYAVVEALKLATQ
jgi:uncharacterized protein with FMN-binding domain